MEGRYFLGLGLLLAATVIGRAFYSLFLSPLRNVPGPFLAKITPYWLILIDIAGNRTRTIHELHQKYGDTVRIGPNELSFSNQEIIKEIYSHSSNFLKAPVYDSFSMPPVGIFSLRNKQDHSRRRRLLSHVFSQSNLLDTEPLIKEHVKTFLAILAGRSEARRSTDALSLFRRLSFDIVGELFLGQQFDGLNSEELPEFLTDMDLHFLIVGIKENFPVIFYLLRALPIPSIRYFLRASTRMVGYGKKAFESYIRQYGRDSGRRDLLAKTLVSKSQGDAPMTDLEIYTEIGNLVFAGTDTTSTTLTYLFWLLAKSPEWQTRLREELKDVAGLAVPTYKDIVDRPVLEAIITDALRLFPAAPASLQRETPPGGRMMNGVFVPEKTVVSMQCYTTHRDPTVYTNPEAFTPERWLNEKGITPEMKAMFLPFSTGSRVCLGIHLAWMELKLITAAIITKYDVTLAQDTTDESMIMMDHFLAAPKGGKCDLFFTSRSEATSAIS